MAYGSAVATIRAALARAKRALTCAEVFVRCPSLRNTTQIASLLNLDVRNGLAVRTGERGAYAYALTDAGRDVVAHPNRTRRAAPRRRARPRRRTPDTTLLAEAIAHADR